jgi:hypothetical protein
VFTVSLRVTDDNATTKDAVKTDYIRIIEAVNTNVVINEVDADSPGTDNAEFIELYDGGAGNTDLTGLVVVNYNGNGDVSYRTIDLACYSTNEDGYFLIGGPGVANADISIPVNGVQNGADAVALHVGNAFDFPNGTPVTTNNLIDAIVYDTDESDDPGLLILLNPGEPQVNENGRGDKDYHSNQRIPNGQGGQRNTSNYDQSPPTPKAANFTQYADWNGSVSTDWHTGGNWHSELVPTTGIYVMVPDTTNDPVISSAAVCNTLDVETGAVVTINNGGSLTVGTAPPMDGASTIVGNGKLEEESGLEE